MAKLRIIPKKFEKCDIPMFAACIYSKSTRKPWCGRFRKTPNKPRQVTYPGQIFSVDQLVPPTQGVVSQMTDILTTKRYKYATVFAGLFSRYSYMQLHHNVSAEDTLEGGHAFYRMTAAHAIIIK